MFERLLPKFFLLHLITWDVYMMLMSPVFLFLTQHLLNFEHKRSDRIWVQTICLLAILCTKEYFHCIHLKITF